MKKLKILDYHTLMSLNESSIRDGRRQNLKPDNPYLRKRQARYPVNFHADHEWDGQQDIRLCVILDGVNQTAWLDVSREEFDAVPEVEVSEIEWEAVMCAGTPLPVP